MLLVLIRLHKDSTYFRMDKDGTSTVDLDEWVEHHLLHPSADITELVKFWKRGTVRLSFVLIAVICKNQCLVR